MTRITLACMAALAAAPAVADNAAVDNAFRLCNVFDATGLLSSPCEVSGWNSAVRLSVDMTSSEARDLCGMIVGFAVDNGLGFKGGWTLNIRSPYSGDNDIAYCTLP